MKFLIALTILSSFCAIAQDQNATDEIFHATCELTPESRNQKNFYFLKVSSRQKTEIQNDIVDGLLRQGFTFAEHNAPGQLSVKAGVNAYIANQQIYSKWIASISFFELSPYKSIFRQKGSKKYSHFLNGFNRAKVDLIKMIPKCTKL